MKLPLKCALDESSSIKLMFPFLFPFPVVIGNGNGNINFIRELTSRAHFIGNSMKIKNQIGTMPLKSLVSHF